jgi:hypothetical protein
LRDICWATTYDHPNSLKKTETCLHFIADLLPALKGRGFPSPLTNGS